MSEKMPPLGTLTDRVQLRRRQSLAEAEGGHARIFVPLGPAWARVRSLGARPGVTADGRAVTLSHSVVLRFRGDVTPGDRIVYRGRDLEVIGAADLNGRRAYLACACSEISSIG